MGSSLSHIAPHRRRDFVLIRCGQYEWSSEFGKESAIIYTREWDEKPGICTSYYRASHDKVLFTFYDAMCEDNLVAVNIEFVALRDGDRLYKFGSVKARQFGENFTVKRRRPIGRQISFWSYEMGRSENQLALCRRDEEYEIQFEAKSPLVVLRNFLWISCDPSKGLVVDRLGFADPVGKCDGLINSLIYDCLPPVDVMDDINFIRRKLMEDDTVVSHGNQGNILPSYQNNAILNTGQSHGLFNGSIFNDPQFHIKGRRLKFKVSQNV